MSLDDLLLTTRNAGITIKVQGDQLVLAVPPGALTPELRDQLQRYKPAILERLAPVTELILLRDGPTVPAPAVLLALDLERRGFRQSVDASGQYQIEPREGLSEGDRARIARWRTHLGAIVSYEAPVCA